MTVGSEGAAAFLHNMTITDDLYIFGNPLKGEVIDEVMRHIEENKKRKTTILS